LTENGATPVTLMTLYYLLEANEQPVAAKEALIAVFRRQPTNRTVRRMLIDHLSETRAWSDMVTTLKPYEADGEVMQGWELSELANAYRQLGDPASARDVITRDRGALAAMRAMYLETRLGNHERALLLFRRFLVTNRLERRFYVPTALEPVAPGGLKTYLSNQENAAGGRRLMFVDLADVPGFAEEFAALWASAAPNRNDLVPLARTRVAAARAAGTLDEMIATLVQRGADGELHARDLYLLAELASEEAMRLEPAVLDALARKLATLELPPELDISMLVPCYRRADEPARAARILAWKLADQLGTERRNLDVVAWVDRLGQLADVAGETTGTVNALIQAAGPPPTEALRDALESRLLALAAEHAADDAPSDLRRTIADRIRRMPSERFLIQTQRVLARQALTRGDRTAFDEHVAELIRLTPLAYGDMVALDAREYLPAAGLSPALVESLAGRLEAAEAGGALDRRDAVRALVLLGWWAHEQGHTPAAEQVLQRGLTLAGETPTDSHVWLLDLAEALGAEEQARGLAQELLRAGRLPYPRVEPLLDKIAATGNEAAVDALLIAAAEHLHHPGVVRRALEAARRAGNEKAAALLSDRLGE
jgi:hypothetical protein